MQSQACLGYAEAMVLFGRSPKSDRCYENVRGFCFRRQPPHVVVPYERVSPPIEFAESRHKFLRPFGSKRPYEPSVGRVSVAFLLHTVHRDGDGVVEGLAVFVLVGEGAHEGHLVTRPAVLNLVDVAEGDAFLSLC